MNNPIVSIVMPAYNAEVYIKQAIESVMCQTFTHWELLIVNDGSTDNTLSIIKAYENKDKRIHVYTISNSGSAKYPRDLAISKSVSNYIITLDADDWIEQTYIENMLKNLEINNADIVFPKMSFFKNNTNEIIHTLPAPSFNTDIIYEGKELVKHTLGRWEIGCNGGLYKREIMNNLCKSEEDRYSKLMNSDEYDTRIYLINATKVSFSHEIYHYRMNSESITQKLSARIFDPIIINSRLISLVINEFGNNTIELKLSKKQAINTLLGLHHKYINNKKRFNIEEREKIKKIIQEGYNSFKLKDLLINFHLLKAILFLNYYSANIFIQLKNAIKRKGQ